MLSECKFCDGKVYQDIRVGDYSHHPPLFTTSYSCDAGTSGFKHHWIEKDPPLVNSKNNNE